MIHRERIILLLSWILACVIGALGGEQIGANRYSEIIDKCERNLPRVKHCKIVAIPEESNLDKIRGSK